MFKNRSLYDVGDFLKYGVDNFEEDMLDSIRDETYSSFRHMYALVNVVCCNIRSVYPESKNSFVKRNDLNVTISPRVKTENTASILWSHTTNTDLINDWQANHSVLLIPERLIRVKPNETQPIQRKRDITNFFTKIPSSKSKTEVTQVPPTKKIKKDKEVKKEGKERPKKSKIKRTIIALENLKGLLRIVASLIKIDQRKILAFSQSKKTTMPFFAEFAQRKLVVPIKLLVMLSDNVKQLFILSLKMK